jgi:hypothetical protein
MPSIGSAFFNYRLIRPSFGNFLHCGSAISYRRAHCSKNQLELEVNIIEDVQLGNVGTRKKTKARTTAESQKGIIGGRY